MLKLASKINVKKCYTSICSVCISKSYKYLKIHEDNCKNYSVKGTSLWRILFYGSDDFALTSLKILNTNRLKNKLVEHLEVVSKTELSTPVKMYAREYGIKINQWPYKIPPNSFDLGVVVSFGKLIPEDVIKAFPYGMINIHPSLLPKYRGPAPIIHTILNGDTETAITLIEIAPKKFDIGKMLVQKKVQVPERATAVELSNILANYGAKILVESLQDFDNIQKNAIPQSTQGITQAPKPKKESSIVNWNTISSQELDRLYRAIGEIYKLQTTWHGAVVRLSDIVNPKEVDDAKVDLLVAAELIKPGSVYFHKKRRIVCIKCQVGWCAFRKFLVTGKSEFNASAFASGYICRVPIEKRCFGT